MAGNYEQGINLNAPAILGSLKAVVFVYFLKLLYIYRVSQPRPSGGFFLVTGQDTWVINAGMEISRDKPVYSPDLLPPNSLQVLSRGIRGEAVLSFKMPEPQRVRNNAVEYSADGGVTWQNGTYSTSSTVMLKGLPSRQSLMFRVCSMGTYQRKSAWTEPVEAFVL